jgi:rsbT co-antagonist protein RsbR
MRIDATDLARRLHYVDFEPEDASRIAKVRPLIESHVDAITESFFESLGQFEDAKVLTGNREALRKARALKRDHVLAMAHGPYDAAYVQQRLELALVYSAVKLETRVFLGAFHHLMRSIGETLMSQAKDPKEAFLAFLSLKRVAFFDLGIIVDALIFEREKVIRQQQEAIRDLSTPILQLRSRMLLLPLVGIIDTLRARQLTEDLLKAIRSSRAKVVVMDITGAAAVDSKVANHLLQTVSAAKLMGATVIVSGVSSDVATTLVSLGIDVSSFNTVGDLQEGIEGAERLLGMRLVVGDDAGAPALADRN